MLAAMRHPNLELAGVVYSFGRRTSLCAVRDPYRAFWFFGGRDDEPMCLGRGVTDVLAGRVALVSYQRFGGAAVITGVCDWVDPGKSVRGLVAASRRSDEEFTELLAVSAMVGILTDVMESS